MEDIFDKKIAIIGSGAIAMSLAALFTGNGFGTSILTRGQKSTVRGKNRYKKNFETLVGKNLVTPKQAKESEKRLQYVDNFEGLQNADIIFECVIEDIEVKGSIFKQVESYCSNLTAIVSTTSALSVEDLAKNLTIYKNKIVIAHPFNPPHLVPFIELVKGDTTEQQSIEVTRNLLEYCGREVVTMRKSAPGFIANRLQHALLREAIHLVEKGYATPKDVDKALKFSFMPRYTSVGLFEHQDAAGLDMVMNIHNYLFPSLCDIKEAQEYITSRCNMGHFGQKTGEGVYSWSEEDIEDFRARAAEPYWKYFNWKIPND